MGVQGRCLDIASISRYLHQIAELEDVLHVEGHVGRCARCRDKLQSMRRHAEALFDDYGAECPEGHACPSLIALDHFLRGELRERQLVRIQEHLRNCPACWQWASARAGAGARLDAVLVDLLPTRVPDLDLRVASLGVRISAGTGWHESHVVPTLAARLEIDEPPPPEPRVAHSRQLHFCRHTETGILRIRVDLFGPEGFRLVAGLEGTGAPALSLWTRLRVHAPGDCVAHVPGASWLLEPGHYFLGACTHAPPLVALSVETDFVTPATLAACAYDACRYGRFRLALRCLARARALQPAVGLYAALHDSVQRFAQEFGLAHTDGEWRWREVEPRQAPLPPLPTIGKADVDLTPERIAAFVRALARRSEAVAARQRTTQMSPRVSRRAFRPAYAAFMPRLRELLPPIEASVEVPSHSL